MWSEWSDHTNYDYNTFLAEEFCVYTRQRNKINIADAVVFRNVTNDDELPDRTNFKQVCIKKIIVKQQKECIVPNNVITRNHL